MNNQLNKEIFNAVFEDLKGYEGLYKISKNGEIWSCKYKKVMSSWIQEPPKSHPNNLKYIVITLKDKKWFLSRLLATHFIPNPENKPEIDHIDRNTLNNSLSNLRWVSRQENANNKKNSICNLTPKEAEVRINHIKSYKKEYQEKWIEKKQIEDPTYIKEHRTNYLANRPEEMKQKERERNNDHYHNGGGKEYQKEHLSKPEVHQKRMEDQRKKRAGMTEEEKEKHNAKAVEYYYAHLEENRIKAREREAKKRAGMTEEQLEAERAKRRKPKA